MSEEEVGRKRKEPPSTSDEEEEVEEVRLDWRMDPEESRSDWTIEIAVGNKSHASYHVHQSMLSVGTKRSGYFARLFQNEGFPEHQTRTSRIELREMAAEVFPTMLDYLYSWGEEPKITHKNSVALHSLGHYFDIRSLRKKVRQFWKTSLGKKGSELEADVLGTYNEHAKLFNDKKAYSAVLEHFLEFFDSVIEVEDKLLKDADPQFWIDVLERNNGAPFPALSIPLLHYCSDRKESLDTETFLKLTDAALLPAIDPTVALQFMQLEKVMAPDLLATKLSSMQERCVDALAFQYSDNLGNLASGNLGDDAFYNDLGSISALVFSSVFSRSMKVAKATIESKQAKLDCANEQLTSLMSHFPMYVVVSGAGRAEVNGWYHRKDTLYEGAPKFVKNSGGDAAREYHLFFGIDGWWHIMVSDGEDPDSFRRRIYRARRDPQSHSLLPPMKKWDNIAGPVADPAPTLKYHFWMASELFRI